MREVLSNRLKKDKLPLIGSLRGGGVLGKDNSLEGILKVLEYEPDIIELDVRISSDGVLYCFHGSIPWGVTMAKYFFRFISFNKIKFIRSHISSLVDILCRIPSEVDVFLDIKNSHIGSQDILNAIYKSHYRGQIWIGSGLRNLSRLRQGLGEDYIYYLNYYFPIRFKRIIRQVRGRVDVIELPEALASAENLNLIRQAGVVAQVSSFNEGDKRKTSLTLKYGNICLDLHDIRTREMLNLKGFHATI